MINSPKSNAIMNGGYLGQYLELLLNEDTGNELLSCFTHNELEQMHLAIFSGAPPPPMDPVSISVDLMQMHVRFDLINELLSQTDLENHLRNCVGNGLLLNTLRAFSSYGSYSLLQTIGAEIGASNLASFFTGGGDSQTNRPFNLLKTP